MSNLIINPQAASDFATDNVSVATVTQYLSQISLLLTAQAAKAIINYTIQTAPGIPSGLPTAASELWQSQWVAQMQAACTSSIDSLQIQIFGITWSLLQLVPNTTNSYADIVAQLSDMFTTAGSTASSTFLSDCTA